MDIQNIASLKEILLTLGFGKSIGNKLLQSICFNPPDFVLTEHLVKEKDILICTICFERKGNEYACAYYDASLLKEMEFPNLSIQGVHILELDRRMTGCDWQFMNENSKVSDLDNEASWQQAKQIEAIVADLSRLSSTDEGKRFADALKSKHFFNLPYNPVVANLTILRSRFDVCQRFYIFNGNGISVDEAYRFLQNKWLEKQIQIKKKQVDNTSENDNESTSSTEGSSLLKKRRISQSAKKQKKQH